jgi:hypothetical protein
MLYLEYMDIIMQEIEFDSKIKNRTIEIPLEFEPLLTDEVTVHLYLKEKKKPVLSEILLRGEVWSAEEISNFEQGINEGYKNWKIEQY